MDREEKYLRLLAVYSTKKVPLKRVFFYENSPVPQSLFTDDGLNVRCVKSDFIINLRTYLIRTQSDRLIHAMLSSTMDML